MANTDRPRLIFHGAVVVLIGLLAGFPTVVEAGEGVERHWHTAHEALIMMGIFMLIGASLLPALVFERRDRKAFVWSLLAMGYGFTLGLILGGIIGENSFSPGDTAATFTAFLGSVVGIGGAFVATGLTMMGARGALKVIRNGGGAQSGYEEG